MHTSRLIGIDFSGSVEQWSAGKRNSNLGLRSPQLQIMVDSLWRASELFRSCPGASIHSSGSSDLLDRRRSRLLESMLRSQFHPHAYLRHTRICLELSRRSIAVDGHFCRVNLSELRNGIVSSHANYQWRATNPKHYKVVFRNRHWKQRCCRSSRRT